MPNKLLTYLIICLLSLWTIACTQGNAKKQESDNALNNTQNKNVPAQTVANSTKPNNNADVFTDNPNVSNTENSIRKVKHILDSGAYDNNPKMKDRMEKMLKELEEAKKKEESEKPLESVGVKTMRANGTFDPKKVVQTGFRTPDDEKKSILITVEESKNLFENIGRDVEKMEQYKLLSSETTPDTKKYKELVSEIDNIKENLKYKYIQNLIK